MGKGMAAAKLTLWCGAEPCAQVDCTEWESSITSKLQSPLLLQGGGGGEGVSVSGRGEAQHPVLPHPIQCCLTLADGLQMEKKMSKVYLRKNDSVCVEAERASEAGSPSPGRPLHR